MRMVYKVRGVSVVCLPSLTVRKEFCSTVSFADFSGMEKREEMADKLSGFDL